MVLPKNDLDNHDEFGETNDREIDGQEKSEYCDKDTSFWLSQHSGDHGDKHDGDGDDLGPGGVGYGD